MSRALEFAAEDVLAVANALIAEAYECDVSYDGRNSYNRCRHCGADVNWKDSTDEIVHATDCVVLIAKDLLEALKREY